MSDWLVSHGVSVRLVGYLGVFVALALAEIWLPRRPLFRRPRRWLDNLGITIIDALLLRLVFPAALIGSAWAGAAAGLGVLNRLDWPAAVELVIALVLLDLAVYLQHVLFHAVPALWKLHRVHHSDLEFDVTTGTRFHPLEMLVSMLVKIAVVTLLGPPVVAVLVFEMILNATAVFNHSNVHFPTALDRVLRWMVVTPDMHRVHHSARPVETNRNFGFNLPWWDRLFGTYLDQPVDGHEAMIIGLRPFRDPNRLTLGWMLALPFVGGESESTSPAAHSTKRRRRRGSPAGGAVIG